MTTALTWHLRLLRHRCNVARQRFRHAISSGEEPEDRPVVAQEFRRTGKIIAHAPVSTLLNLNWSSDRWQKNYLWNPIGSNLKKPLLIRQAIHPRHRYFKISIQIEPSTYCSIFCPEKQDRKSTRLNSSHLGI